MMALEGALVALTMPCKFQQIGCFLRSLLCCLHLEMTLSDLVCIISPMNNFPVVRRQIGKDDLFCMVTVSALYDLNPYTDSLIFFFLLQI